MEEDNAVQVYAKNDNIYPVTIEVQVELENLTPDQELPYIGVIDAMDEKKIMELTYAEKTRWSYSSRYKYYMGDIHTEHDDHYAYRLPYKKGIAYKINQGYNSRFTHKGTLQYSLDFDMQEGEEVYAARSGVVVKLQELNSRGGASEEFMDDANYVTIMHEDGTFADYSHLKKDGVLVEKGQEVRRGQLIAYSGNTGYTTGPHLHFTVKKARKGGGFVSVPVRFHTKNGVVELAEGYRYTAY